MINIYIHLHIYVYTNTFIITCFLNLNHPRLMLKYQCINIYIYMCMNIKTYEHSIRIRINMYVHSLSPVFDLSQPRLTPVYRCPRYPRNISDSYLMYIYIYIYILVIQFWGECQSYMYLRTYMNVY
jgi:hypothetical protein